eukprot:m.137234 g.137234  ORF g.137234 m.137234 type:complete len:480 (+) comp11469_c0_seq1:60-1499(+)
MKAVVFAMGFIVGAFFFIATVVPSFCDGLMHPPEWAMGGEFGKMHNSSLFAVTLDSSQEFALKFPLDHFSKTSKFFDGRYYVEDSNFHPGSSCFFYMGGEGPNNGIRQDYVYYLAQKHNALIVSIEHRFYGKSVPFDDFSVNNLQYLTSEQALADAAYLIQQVNNDGKYKCANWFAFGGSYSGALSAWFRIKYPHVIVGSLSSSGVVNAILNFTAFDTHVSSAIGATCTLDVQRISSAFAKALANSSSSAAEAKKLFGASASMADGDFAYMIADSAAMADQYNHKDKLCTAVAGMANEKEVSDQVAMETFAQFTNSYWGADFGSSCFYNSECVRNDPKQWQPTARSWWWQKCHELAYWQNAPVNNSLRLPLLTYEYHKQRCEYQFVKGTYPDTNFTNSFYGGDQPDTKNATNIYFSDFSDDPWMEASVLSQLNDDLPYQLVTCDGCGHCFDLGHPSESDPQVLQQSRARFEKYLATWLA